MHPLLSEVGNRLGEAFNLSLCESLTIPQILFCAPSQRCPVSPVSITITPLHHLANMEKITVLLFGLVGSHFRRKLVSAKKRRTDTPNTRREGACLVYALTSFFRKEIKNLHDYALPPKCFENYIAEKQYGGWRTWDPSSPPPHFLSHLYDLLCMHSLLFHSSSLSSVRNVRYTSHIFVVEKR